MEDYKSSTLKLPSPVNIMKKGIKIMKTTNTIVANALAVKGVVKNALDVNQQREIQEAIPKVKAEVEKMHKEAAPLIAKSKQVIEKYDEWLNSLQKVKADNKAFYKKWQAYRSKYPSYFSQDSAMEALLSDLYYPHRYFHIRLGYSHIQLPVELLDPHYDI